MPIFKSKADKFTIKKLINEMFSYFWVIITPVATSGHLCVALRPISYHSQLHAKSSSSHKLFPPVCVFISLYLAVYPSVRLYVFVCVCVVCVCMLMRARKQKKLEVIISPNQNPFQINKCIVYLQKTYTGPFLKEIIFLILIKDIIFRKMSL